MAKNRDFPHAAHQTMRQVLIVLVAVIGPHQAAHAAHVDFVREVRPIFEKHCYKCHGAEKQKSGLRLDVKSAAFEGGEVYAPNIVPGEAQESPLIQFVTGEDKDMLMPPEGERLSQAEIATLTKWIEEGAVWPEGVDTVKLSDKRDHWSFKPISDPAPPTPRDPDWSRNPIDRFVLARLEMEGLRPAPEADPVAWLRRTSLNLTGLPPTPAEVATFLKGLEAETVSDESRTSPRPQSSQSQTISQAYEQAVDRLLESPGYGERWAQHWLDVVRYADTHGFEVNTERPHAWPYRDYVIRAFNEDTPYDRFIREQIVGDAWGADAATGFLVTASVLLPGQIGKDAPSIRLARQDSLDEIVINVGQTFLGLSLGCARCHDHKFDPITARDYYSMQAFVAGVEYEDRELRNPEAAARNKDAAAARERDAWIGGRLSQLSPPAVPGRRDGVFRPTVRAPVNTDRFAPVRAKRVRFTILATNSLEPCVDELEVFNTEGTNVALASAGAKLTTSGDKVDPNRHEPRFLNDGHLGNERSWMSSERGRGWVEIEFAREEEISRVVWGRDRLGKYEDRLATDYVIEVAGDADWRVVADASDRRPFVAGMGGGPEFTTDGLPPDEAAEVRRLLDERGSLAAKTKDAEAGQLAFAGKFRTPDTIYLLDRGDPEQPTEEVAPAVPSALDTLTLPNSTPEQQRRRALADWIASSRNPLTARVFVNRLWQGHFGTGLVETSSEFGHSGMKPSHPELLDWLAREFMRSGWSIKHMQRLIVLSATYRQATRKNDVAALKDADVRLLWCYPSRRLDAEAIRDSMLAVSGRLDRKMFGPGFDLFDKRGGLTGFTPIESFSGDGLRRMIYAHKVRRERDAVFGAFDCPDAGQSTPRRGESTTPIQALNLFNSRFTIDESRAFAARVQSEAGGDATEQIRHAWRLALCRDPHPDELADAKPVLREHGLDTLCRVLFNCNEFLFLP